LRHETTLPVLLRLVHQKLWRVVDGEVTKSDAGSFLQRFLERGSKEHFG